MKHKKALKLAVELQYLYHCVQERMFRAKNTHFFVNGLYSFAKY